MYDIDMYVYRPERALGDPKVRRNGGGGVWAEFLLITIQEIIKLIKNTQDGKTQN